MRGEHTAGPAGGVLDCRAWRRTTRSLPLLLGRRPRSVLAGLAPPAAGGGRAVEVEVARVEKRPVFRSTVTASGEIVAERYADVGSSVMGKLVSLPVKEGDRVRQGQVVARIDSVPASSDAGRRGRPGARGRGRPGRGPRPRRGRGAGARPRPGAARPGPAPAGGLRRAPGGGGRRRRPGRRRGAAGRPGPGPARARGRPRWARPRSSRRSTAS